MHNFIHPDGGIIWWVERPVDREIREFAFGELTLRLQLVLPPPDAKPEDQPKFDKLRLLHRQENVVFLDGCLGLNTGEGCPPLTRVGGTVTFELTHPTRTVPEYYQYRTPYDHPRAGRFVKVQFANGGPLVPLAPVVLNKHEIWEQA